LTIPSVESFARFGGAHYVYADIAEKSYSEYREIISEIDTYIKVEHGEKLFELKRARDIARVQTVVFSAMTFEAAIYDFASIHLGDEYFRNHLDRLDVISKWLVVLRFVAGIELPKDEAPYAALKSLIFERNRLIHFKSEPFDPDDLASQLAKIKKRESELAVNVHNSFRALILVSLYLDKVMDQHHNPLPSYNKKNAPMRRYYSQLKIVIEDCRNVVAKTGRS